jgi:hypothetical protein
MKDRAATLKLSVTVQTKEDFLPKPPAFLFLLPANNIIFVSFMKAARLHFKVDDVMLSCPRSFMLSAGPNATKPSART